MSANRRTPERTGGGLRRRRLAMLLLLAAWGGLGLPGDAGAQQADTSRPDESPRRSLVVTGLVSAAGAGLGVAAGFAATDAVTDTCDLCWEGYVLTFGANVAGAAGGAMLVGADGSRSLAGALLGLGAGAGVAGVMDAHRVDDTVQIISYLLVQGLTTALVDRYADELLRAIRWRR